MIPLGHYRRQMIRSRHFQSGKVAGAPLLAAGAETAADALHAEALPATKLLLSDDQFLRNSQAPARHVVYLVSLEVLG